MTNQNNNQFNDQNNDDFDFDLIKKNALDVSTTETDVETDELESNNTDDTDEDIQSVLAITTTSSNSNPKTSENTNLELSSNILDDEGFESNDENDCDVENNHIFYYRMGNAINETQQEYEIFRTYLEMGRGRVRGSLCRIFSLSNKRVFQISKKNNWDERIDAYDRQTYLNSLSRERDAREIEHQRKLENYRAQQETLANQASVASAKMLHLVNQKLSKLLQNEDVLSIDEMISVGNLTSKLVQLQKEVGAQALGVDVLLQALDEQEE